MIELVRDTFDTYRRIDDPVVRQEYERAYSIFFRFNSRYSVNNKTMIGYATGFFDEYTRSMFIDTLY